MIPAGSPLIRLVPTRKPELLHEQIRTSLYNKYQHGPQKITNPEVSVFRWWKENLIDPEKRKRIIADFKHMAKWPFKMEFNKPIPQDKTVIFEHFDSDESIKRWKPVCDRDGLNGYSTSNISRSPAGHALFHGVIDNTLPDDGLTANAGFAALIGPRKRQDHLFDYEPVWNWMKFNCLEIKFRGDGRKYAVIVNTASHFDDLTYYDNYSFPIHTRGGPYWQTVQIPFSKFIFNYKGFIQDRQGYLPNDRIGFVGFALHDKVDGPFALEIDYLGLRSNSLVFRESTAYETYRIKHIRWRPLQVDCPPPQVE